MNIATTAIPTRVATVAAVCDVGPGLRQITFSGLRDVRRIGLDDFFLLIRPRPEHAHMLDTGADFAEHRDLPETERPGWAYYTARRWRPDAGEVDIWFVLHGNDGPISGWARQAAVGDRMALWGPRISFDPPPGTKSLLLVGDETGLGAIASIIDGADPAWPITALIESDHGLPPAPLGSRPGVDLRCIGRDGAARGTGIQLLDAVARLDLDADGLYAYGAGESHIVSEVRVHLRRERFVPAPQVQMVGYWRRTP